jgi:hypothetical protein
MFVIKLRMMGWWWLVRATCSETSKSNIGMRKWIIKTLRVIIGVKQNGDSGKIGTVVTRDNG